MFVVIVVMMSTILSNGSKIRDLKLREELLTANVTICAVAKNEERYIDEWLTYHKYLGFDHVQIYDNADNASSYMADLPRKYGNYVSVEHSPGLGRQESSYNRCLKNGAETNTWAAFLDVDEFVVLKKHPNIKAFLHDVAPDGGSIVLNWSIMVSNGTMVYDPAPVVTRFTVTSREANRNLKTIAYLPHVQKVHVHYSLMKRGHPTVDQHGRAVKDGASHHPGNDREIANLNHYQTKSWEEFNQKRRRGFATNYQGNQLFSANTPEAANAMAVNFKVINNLTDPVIDTTARDFYLMHTVK